MNDTEKQSNPPARVVERYLSELYNHQRIDLVPELIADTTWRHTPGGLVQLTIDQSIARIKAFFERYPQCHFDSATTVAQDDRVAVAWSARMTTRNGKQIEAGGIELFRILDGKIVETWNQDPPGSTGLWHPSPLE